jgi:uncharacterized membrane protein YccC
LDVHVVNGSNERREKMFGLSLKQTIGGIAGIILGIIVSLINPPASLDTNAMIALGVFICAVTWWIKI